MADHDRSRSPPRMLKQEDEPDRGTDQDVKYEQDEGLPEKDIMETGNQRDTEETMSISSSRASTASGHSSNADPPRTSNSKQRPVTLARTASILPDAIVVPRSQRRGLLARFALIPEVENPEHYARQTKWFLTFIVAFCAMAAPMGSAIVMPVLQEISTAFNATETVTNMSVAVYMLSMSIFPLWWSSFFGATGQAYYIHKFVHTLRSICHPLCHQQKHRHAYCLPCSVWRRSSICTSGRGRDHRRCLGDERAWTSNGYLLSWVSNSHVQIACETQTDFMDAHPDLSAAHSSLPSLVVL